MPTSDQRAQLRERRDRLLGEVGQPLDRGQIGAALEARDEDVVQQARADRGAHARGGAQPRCRAARRRREAARRRRRAARAPRARCDRRRPRGGACDAPRGAAARRLAPLAVGGHDQRRDLAGRRERRLDRRDGVGRDVLRAPHRAHPARDGIRERDDVAGERRVGGEVPGRVVADHSSRSASARAARCGGSRCRWRSRDRGGAASAPGCSVMRP